MNFGVKALGTIARRAEAEVGGETGVTLTVAGLTIRPGDWITPMRFRGLQPEATGLKAQRNGHDSCDHRYCDGNVLETQNVTGQMGN